MGNSQLLKFYLFIFVNPSVYIYPAADIRLMMIVLRTYQQFMMMRYICPQRLYLLHSARPYLWHFSRPHLLTPLDSRGLRSTREDFARL